MAESKGVNPDEFEADRLYDEFDKEHSGHELEVEDGFNKTVSYSGTFNTPTVATAHCPLCDVTEEVIYHDRICPHHPYGKHITIVCTNCGEEGTTKNIKHIGARSVYVSCNCEWEYLEHKCEHE
jgi:hypothetical protein